MARPGQTVTFPLALHNRGETSQDVQLNATGDLPPGWSTPTFLFRSESLASVGDRLNSVSPTGEEGVPLELTIEIPEDASGGVATSILAAARAVGLAAGEPDLLPLNIHVEPFVEIVHDLLPPLTVPPGETREQAVRLTNEGNVEARLSIHPVSAPQGLDVELPTNMTIPAGGNQTLVANVSAPPGAPPGQEPVSVLLVDESGASTQVQLPVRVPEGPRLTINGSDDQSVLAGAATDLTLVVSNRGNARSNTSLELRMPDGWSGQPSTGTLRLGPTDTRVVHLEIRPPAGAAEVGTVELIGREAGQIRTLHHARVTPVIADFGIEGAGTIQGDGDGTVAARGVVVNRANVTLTNLTVALVADGEILSSTVLDRVPPGTPRVAVVTTSLEETPDGLRLTVDPGARIPEPDRSDNTAPVRPGDTDRETPLPVWIPVASALVAVLLTRRRLRSDREAR